MKASRAVLLMTIAACSLAPPAAPPPDFMTECANAAAHFYAVGCQYDPNSGTVTGGITQAQLVTKCETIAATETCTEGVQEWIECLSGEVGLPADAGCGSACNLDEGKISQTCSP